MPENPHPTTALRQNVDCVDDFCFAAVALPAEPREQAPVRAATARRDEPRDVFEQDPVGVYLGNNAEHACAAFTRIIETLPVPRRRVRLARESGGKDVDFLVMKCTPVRAIEVAEIRSLGKFMGKNRAGCGIDFSDCDKLVGNIGKLECCRFTCHAGAKAEDVDCFAIDATWCSMRRLGTSTGVPLADIA